MSVLSELKAALNPAHFLPGLRAILILESTTEEDVDAISKVHRLSFFSFSSVQCLVMLMLSFQDSEPMLCSAWTLTEYVALVSFGSSFLLELFIIFSAKFKDLKSGIKMEAMLYNNKFHSLYLKAYWLVLVQLVSDQSKDD